MVNFPTRIHDCGFFSSALLKLFLSPGSSICSTVAFPPLGNSNLVVVLFSTDFSSKSKRHAPFHHTAYSYSRTDWDGLLHHLRDVPW